jgi:tRNA modification GTPase
MNLQAEDTIVAIATPSGAGAISIVRMSGPEALAISDSVFRGSAPLSNTPSYTMCHGRVVDATGDVIDQVLAAVFHSPRSYTGEDMVEINCHGGVFVTRKVLSALIEAGARHADPGEFTKRAFLNGKIDLARAEAVADLIAANSDRALRNSNAQLGGVIGNKVRSIKDELVRIRSLLELQLDFGAEDIEIASRDSIRNSLVACVRDVNSALSSYRAGRAMRDGISVAIVGRPNVGKSSLFNSLLKDDRSIVSSSPGTTRDFVEESLIVDGIMIKLYDTAGLRLSRDEVELCGVARTANIASFADIILLVVDNLDDTPDLGPLGLGSRQDRIVLLVQNKADILSIDKLRLKDRVYVSATTGEGLDELRQKIASTASSGVPWGGSDLYVSSARQFESLNECARFAEEAVRSVASGVENEFVASDLALAIEALSAITGEVTSDDILNKIFSSFCIGK